MIEHRMNHALGALALGFLTACGGGSGPGAPDIGTDPIQDAAFPNLREAHYQTALGLPLDEHTPVSSIAVADSSSAGQRTGTISLATDRDRRVGYRYDTDAVELAVNYGEGEGPGYAFPEQYLFVAVGEDFIDQGFTVVGETTLGDGRAIVIAEHDFSGRRIYVPADGSPVRVGAFSTSADDGDMVAHSVFGIETEIADLAGLAGSGSFKGLSEASVVGGAAAGNYRGTSEGTLDFGTGAFSVSANMANDAMNEINVSSTGVMTDAGELAATMVVDGMLSGGGRVDGQFQGQIFGAGGDDIGGTFSGGTGSTNLAGQMLMSR